jgi:hypothetical protein
VKWLWSLGNSSALFVPKTPATITLKVADSSETLVSNYQSRWHHISESIEDFKLYQSNTIGIGQQMLIELGQDESLG